MPAARRPTVIHVTNCWYPMVGGITTTVARLAATTEERLGIPTRVIAYPACVHGWVQRPGFRLVRRVVHAATVGSVLLRVAGAVALQRLRGRKVAVHSHSAGFCLVAGALSTLLGARAVHTVSSSVFEQPLKLGWAGGIYRWAARRVTAVVYCCEALRREQEMLLSPRRTAVILWGVDGSPPEASANTVSLREAAGQPDGPLVLWVGHLIARKDPVLAVQGLPFVPKVHLAMLGEGELRDELEARIAELGVQHRTHLLGSVPHSQYLRYLMEADVLLVTSRAEGLPQTIFDAMLARTPIAATPVSGIPEMVVDGETGVIVRERTGEAVAEALRRALDGRIRERIVAGAHERVTTSCAWPTVAGKYTVLYGPGGEGSS